MHYAHIFSVIAEHITRIIIAGGYPLIFIAVALEGVPLVGSAIPGHVAIITAGFFAKVGPLSLIPVLVVSTVAAIVGDFIGYYLGRKYGMPLIARLRPYFFIKDSHIEKANSILEKHTGKALIMGRFSPFTRGLMPFLVGVSGANVSKFWFFNIVGGLAWVVTSVFIGYGFGASYDAVAKYLGPAVVIATLVAIIIVWGYRFVNERFHIFRKYELFTLILNVLSLWGFAAILDQLTDKDFSPGFDVYVNTFFDALNHSHAWVTTISIWVSNIGGTEVTSLLGMIVGFALISRKKWRSASVMILSIVSTLFTVAFLKQFFMVGRPENALVDMVGDPSFPSGHAALAAALFMSLVYVFAPKIKSLAQRELLIILSVIVVVLIGISRLVLSVHWASDVIAGWCLGVFLVTATVLLVRYVGALFISKPRDYK